MGAGHPIWPHAFSCICERMRSESRHSFDKCIKTGADLQLVIFWGANSKKILRPGFTLGLFDHAVFGHGL